MGHNLLNIHLNHMNHSSFIQGRVQISNELKQRKVGEEATKSQELIRNAHKVCPGCAVITRWKSD